MPSNARQSQKYVDAYSESVDAVEEAMKPLTTKAQEMFGSIWHNLDDKQKISVQLEIPREYNRYRDAVAKMGQARQELEKNKEIQFRSSHFDEPNILVHLRMNTRTDSEGKKVLFLEEVQSDWGQHGKKEGFKENQITELPKEYEINEPSKFHGWLVIEPKGVAGATQDVVIADESTKEEAVQSAIKKLNNRLREKNIPKAPYVTDTNSWVKLGLKYALRHAIDIGADKIAWTTGEQQAERYKESLVAEIEEVEITSKSLQDPKSTRGLTFIPFEGRGGAEGIYLEVDDNGIITYETNVGALGKMKGKPLSEVLTKGMAEDIMSRPKDTSFKPEDLKINAQGMIGFYGSPAEGKTGIVGNVAKSLIKELTGKEGVIGESTVQTGETYAILNDKGKEIWSGSKDSYDRMMKDTNGLEPGETLIEPKSKQSSIDITPEVRSAVEKGMALYQKDEGVKRGAVKLLQDGKAIVYAMTDPNVVTPLHELAHVYQNYLKAEEKSTILKWAGTEVWTTETSEKFARGFEQYLKEGKAPQSTLQKIFDKFKKWLTDIYNSTKEELVLSDAMRSIYSQMLGVEIPVEAKAETTEAVYSPSGVTPPPTGKVAEKPLKDENLPEYTIGVRALNSDKLDQDIKDAIAKEGINYIPRGRAVRAEEAQEIIRLFSQEPNGLDKIELAVRDTKNDIMPDTRTFLNVYLTGEYIKRRDASTDPAERELYKDKGASMIQFGMEQGYFGGLLTEAQKEWRKVLGNSPDMLVALVQKHINDKNRGFFTTHEEEIQATKKLLDDIFGSEEGRARIEQEVQAEIEKIGTKNFGAESKKKIDDFFNGLLIDPKRQNLYGGLLGIPVAAWNGSVLAVKNAVLLGVDIASAIQKGVEYLDKWHKDQYAKGKIASPDWNKTEYQSHMKEKLGGLKKEVPVKEKPTTKRKAKPKTPPTSEEVLNKVLEKMAGFATKKQLQNFIKDYIQEHTEKGYVDDQRYKDLLAKALGLDYISDKVQAEITANARALGHAQKKVQEVIDAFEKLLALDPKSREFAELRKQLDILKKEADKAQFNAQKANMEIKKLLSEEPELLDKMGTLIQGNLLVFTSIIRNVYGNTFLAPLRATRYVLMNVMDWMLSYTAILADEARAKIDPVKHPDLYRFAQKLPSRERTVSISGSIKGGYEGFWKGLKEGLVQLKTGQLEDDYNKKEIQRGLEPIQAMMRIRDSLTGVKKRSWDKLVGDILEAMPAGYVGEAMFRLLNIGDKPYRRRAERARLSEIAKIKGLTGLRREQFMNNPDNASLIEAQKAGDYAVYTNDNFVSKIIEYANQTFNKGAKSKTDALKSASIIGKALFKLGKATTLPYVRTPVNLAIETFEYAIPMYSLGRGFEAMYKGNRRESLDYFSKAIVGAMISSVAITLLKSGIMTPAGSDDDKLRQAEFTAKEGYRLNIDALQRKISGDNPAWQDGDNTVTIKGYGTLSMILMAYGAAYKDKTPEEMGQESITERWATVFGSVVSSALEQSIMTGVNTALQAALKGEKERDRWLVNTATALSTVVYPSTLASISKTFADENYLRETRDLSLEEGQLKAQMINTFKDRMFMGKNLPTKVSIWGEPVKIIPDGNTWTYNLLGVSKNKKYQKYSFGTRMYELYEEYKKTNPDEAKSIFPSLPSPATKVGWEKSKMTPEQLQNYQIRVGELRAEFAENYVNSEEFINADIEDRILTLTNMYSKARRRADSEMFRWSTFQQTVPAKWKVLLDNDAVPIPSATKIVKMGSKSFNLEPDDVRKLNEMALDRYAERLTPYIEGNKDRLVELKKVNEKTGKIPFVEKANDTWDDAIEYAKKQMAILLRGKAE
ncbi:MAG: hypothetical protein BWY21_01631 [Parcubacteria group bacterium ADurb.Bin216]|nr:MAG: hypothetical protein BWY21_01631 [Parcubacteria group bacterium ADurb.Bin216]